MQETKKFNPPFPDEYARRAARAWWADGLWDIAMAGAFVLVAIWAYIWVRIMAFPVWTWPWPFITNERVNPMELTAWLWLLGILPVVMVYSWGGHKLVQIVKTRVVAPRVGDVRHPFGFLKNSSVYLCMGLSLVGAILLVGVYSLLGYGPRFISAAFTVIPAGILFVIGRISHLTRYVWASLVGLTLGVALELFCTQPAVIDLGPRSLVDVSPLFGNPALPLLVWCIALLCSGAVGMFQRMRRGNSRQQHGPRP